MSIKVLPSTITSYDLLKTFAVVTMIIDHVGANFYPDEDWWRVVGRMSVPVWLFLVGYAKSRDMSAPLWIGTAIILATNFVVGQALLPLCIFATILLCRFMLDPVMYHIKQKPSNLYPAAFLMFVLTIPVAAAVDYGLSVFLFAMLGYMVRNRDELPFASSHILGFAIAAAALHGVMQVFVFFPFDETQKITAMVGIAVVTVALTRFRAIGDLAAASRWPNPIQGIVRFCGRKTLEIYVVHLVVFKLLALALGVKGFTLFDFHIY